MSVILGVDGDVYKERYAITQRFYELWNKIRNLIFCTNVYGNRLIPMAARSKAWVCCRSRSGIEGSNPTDGMDICVLLSAVCCQVKVSATGPIPRPKKSHRLCACVTLSVVRCSTNSLDLQ